MLAALTAAESSDDLEVAQQLLRMGDVNACSRQVISIHTCLHEIIGRAEQTGFWRIISVVWRVVHWVVFQLWGLNNSSGGNDCIFGHFYKWLSSLEYFQQLFIDICSANRTKCNSMQSYTFFPSTFHLIFHLFFFIYFLPHLRTRISLSLHHKIPLPHLILILRISSSFSRRARRRSCSR